MKRSGRASALAEVAQTGSARLRIAAVAVVALVAVVIYLGAINGEFVWDDFALIGGSGIGGGDSLAACFRTAFLDHFYRPLVSVSFLVDRRLWPNDAAASHWVNILLHGLGSAVVVLLGREVHGRWSFGVMAGLLFAVHPVHVGAVAWIGGRTDALGCLWTGVFAWTLVAAARRNGDARTVYTVFSVIAYLLAVFTKEQSLFLLPLVPLAFACFKPSGGVVPRGEGWFLLTPYVVVAAFFLAIGAFEGMPKPPPLWVTPAEQAVRFGHAVLGYAGLLLVPTQAAMHSFSLAPWEEGMPWTASAGFALAVGTVALWVRLMLHDRANAWALALVILGVLPVSNALPMPFLLFAPYRAAVPSIGLALMLARCFGSLRWDLPGFRAAPAAVSLAAATTWYAVQTMRSIPNWHSEERLFTAVTQHDPGTLVAWYMLARLAVNSEQDADAARYLRSMLARLYGSDAWERRGAALAALRDDRRVRARFLQNQGRRGDPEDFAAMLYTQLGCACMNSDDVPGAIEAFHTALGWRPDDALAHHGLGWCLARQGDWAGAERSLLVALQTEPTPEVRRLLATVYERQGRHERAVEQWSLATGEPQRPAPGM